MKPVIYVALPNKNDEIYDIFLKELIIYVQANDAPLDPKSILIDFEMAAYTMPFQNTFQWQK
jgi:hypothetical protein